MNYFFSFVLTVLMIFSSVEIHGQKGKKELASTHKEYVKMFKNPEVNMIRTHSDFLKWFNTSTELKKHFNENSLRVFGKGLKISENGLVSFKLDMLKIQEKELNKLGSMILEGFGFSQEAQKNDATIEGAYCGGDATCYASVGCWCVIANCKMASDIKTGFDEREILSIGW